MNATNLVVTVFSLSDIAAYETYRQRAAHDDEARAATAYFQATKCFLSYERSFLRPLLPENQANHCSEGERTSRRASVRIRRVQSVAMERVTRAGDKVGLPRAI